MTINSDPFSNDRIMDSRMEIPEKTSIEQVTVALDCAYKLADSLFFSEVDRQDLKSFDSAVLSAVVETINATGDLIPTYFPLMHNQSNDFKLKYKLVTYVKELSKTYGNLLTAEGILSCVAYSKSLETEIVPYIYHDIESVVKAEVGNLFSEISFTELVNRIVKSINQSNDFPHPVEYITIIATDLALKYISIVSDIASEYIQDFARVEMCSIKWNTQLKRGLLGKQDYAKNLLLKSWE